MRRKLKKFQEITKRGNVICPGKEIYENINGRWNEIQFENDYELVLELGCGRGEYTIGLAQVYPDKNFIGTDIKGDRIWAGSTGALSAELSNAAFLRTQIQFLPKFFNDNEVSEIWITFPDPRPKSRDEKRRLTSPRYLELYKQVLKSDGFIHLKTDNTALFDYSLEIIQGRTDVTDLEFTHDLYNSPHNDIHHGIKTKYETIFTDLGENIKYLRFRFIE